ncbi:GtrA family protein [Celeribacter litoreus]|uniref:GtrA family protein n=1 Tax=Celeribacter litoreus TaxID=2876714 RepID=UPI001CCCE3C5|nr:GtrA family protein [Celeribacter litoreus]MCA0041998.1 GtrA family protein [Celeribacter litoreus]
MMLIQLLRFGFVGALATLVHMLIGATLIHSGWPALASNPVSFLIAFVISFMGHYGFSFADQEKEMGTSLRRFIVVACSGFVVNETILGFLVWSSSLSQVSSLLLSTGVAAMVTFFASRNWAFRHVAEGTVRATLGR